MTALHPNGSAPELKFIALDLALQDQSGVFEGYASLFNREDLARDIVVPGAFRQSLAERGVSGIRMLFQHDPAQPIGVWQAIAEDQRGLRVTGKLALDTEKARDVLALMKAGALDGLSIGFKATKVRRDAKTGVRRLERIDLWEISVVTFPMMPGARVGAIKARQPAQGIATERDFERWLTQDAGLSRSEARALMRSGLGGLRALRDAGRNRGSGDDALAGQIRRAADLIRRQTPSNHRT